MKSKYKRKFIVFLIGFILINALWSCISTSLLTYPFAEQISYTISESKQKDCYISTFLPHPSTFIWKGHTHKFKDIWVEHRTKLIFNCSIFPCFFEIPINKKIEGFNLCLTFEDYDKINISETLFFLENEGFFGQLGTVIYFCQLDSIEGIDGNKIKVQNKINNPEEVIKISLKR